MFRNLITIAIAFFAIRLVTRVVRGLSANLSAARSGNSRQNVNNSPEEADFEIIDENENKTPDDEN
jgi:hypothetical protein